MLNFETLVDVSTELRSGKVSSRELCQDAIDRIERLNPVIGAFSDLLIDTALADADAADERRRRSQSRGSVDGVPIAIKDLIDVRGAICAAGLDHLEGYRPDTDAEVVDRLRRAGAIVLGVTATDSGAFGTSTPQCTNPIDPARICGGSSGGSAAAVAAGMVFGAFGTDTGGSIRIPAACCSIAGFKPTWGRVSTEAVRPLAASFDHVGPLARSVADLTILQSTIDPDFLQLDEQAEGRQRPRLGIAASYVRDAADTTKAAFGVIVDNLRAQHHRIESVRLPDVNAVIATHLINVPKEAADYHTQRFPDAWAQYPAVARDTIELGLNCRPDEYAEAERQRLDYRDAVDRVFEDVDAVLLPTLPVDCPMRTDERVQLGDAEVSVLEATIRYTALFNQTGHPVVSLPACVLDDGRAVSIQVVGPRDSDRALLRLAAQLETDLGVIVDYMHLGKRTTLAAPLPPGEVPTPP